MLTLNHVTKSFSNNNGQLKVLASVSFGLNQSEIIAILGPSGCGKTTLLKIIAGLIKPDSGEIIYGEKQARQDFKISIIWQDHRLFPWLKVGQNLGFGLNNTNVDEVVVQEKIEECLGLIGLKDFVDYYPNQLSGGMQAKVAIGRALMARPDILLMDEPFASVDYQTKILLFKAVKKIQKTKQLPIIYVTHDTRDAIAFADQVIILSARPARIKKVINTRGIDVLSSNLEKEIWELLKNNNLVTEF